MSAKLFRDVVQKKLMQICTIIPTSPSENSTIGSKTCKCKQARKHSHFSRHSKILTGIAYFLVKIESIYLNLQLNNLYIPEDIHSLTAKDNW